MNSIGSSVDITCFLAFLCKKNDQDICVREGYIHRATVNRFILVVVVTGTINFEINESICAHGP